MQNKKFMLTGAVLTLCATAALAGDGGAEFAAIYDLLEDWATGTLGKVIALAALIVGIGFGLVRQSVIAAVVGVSMALVLNYGPTVIGNIFTATAEMSAEMTPAVMMLTNGLL